MDCVVPCEDVEPVMKDGIITSGSDTVLGADDKAAIAMLIEVARTISEEKSETPDIYFLFTVSEEVGLHGAKNMEMDFIPDGHVFVLDGESGVGAITTASPYSEKFRIRVKGKAAHSGIEPENGIDAIKIVSHAISRLDTGRIDRQTTMNIGKIHGGHAVNIVPDNVVVEGEIRCFSKTGMNSLLKKIETVFKEETEGRKGAVSFKHFSEFTGFKLSEKEDVVRIACQGAAKKGIRTEIISSGGGSDANVFNEKGFPAVVLAIGFENAHTKQEQISIANLKKGVELILGIIEVSKR